MKDVICPICGTLMRIKNSKTLDYICPKCKYIMNSLNYRNIRKE